MKHLRGMIAGAALLAAVAPAAAADMALKAAPVPLFSGGSGFYGGVGTEVGVAASNVSNGAFPSPFSLVTTNMNATGGAVDVAFGYIHGNTANPGFFNWYRLQATGAYQNITATNGPVSVASRWSASQEFDVGADLLTYITSVVGNLGVNWPTINISGALPANIATQVGVPKQYFGFKVIEYGINGNVGSASGTTVAIAPGLATGLLYPTIDGTGKPNGGAIDVWASITWNDKGATIGNLFAANGAPIAFNASAIQSTSFFAGVRVNFAAGRGGLL